MPLPLGVTIAGGLLGLGADLFGQHRDREQALDIAKFQAAYNERMIDKQNFYNSPAQQMARFKEAGLNPNLIYGQGNPGNQSSAPQYPSLNMRPREYGQIAALSGQLMQTKLMQSQVEAIDAKVRKDGAQTELLKLQKDVLARNPLLNKATMNAIYSGLISTAEMKSNQAKESAFDLRLAKSQTFISEASAQAQVTKINKEIAVLEERYKLAQADNKIKAEILDSKQFQNDILEVQKKFIADGEIGAQQILLFLQMLISKF